MHLFVRSKGAPAWIFQGAAHARALACALDRIMMEDAPRIISSRLGFQMVHSDHQATEQVAHVLSPPSATSYLGHTPEPDPQMAASRRRPHIQMGLIVQTQAGAGWPAPRSSGEERRGTGMRGARDSSKSTISNTCVRSKAVQHGI